MGAHLSREKRDRWGTKVSTGSAEGKGPLQDAKAGPPGVRCAGTHGNREEVFHVVHGCISHSLVGTQRIHVGLLQMVAAASARGLGRSRGNMK